MVRVCYCQGGEGGNHSKSIKTVVSLLCIPYQKDSRDATVLIDLLWFNVVHYSSLFQYFFFRSTKVPTLIF